MKSAVAPRAWVRTVLGDVLASPSDPSRIAYYMSRSQAAGIASRYPGAVTKQVRSSWIVIVELYGEETQG